MEMMRDGMGWIGVERYHIVLISALESICLLLRFDAHAFHFSLRTSLSKFGKLMQSTLRETLIELRGGCSRGVD